MKAKTIAISIWNDGIQDIERIARLTNLSLKEVRKAIGMKDDMNYSILADTVSAILKKAKEVSKLWVVSWKK